MNCMDIILVSQAMCVAIEDLSMSAMRLSSINFETISRIRSWAGLVVFCLWADFIHQAESQFAGKHFAVVQINTIANDKSAVAEINYKLIRRQNY